MAESRHRTVIEIGVDDREVRGLGATMDRTFSTKTIDAFERSLDRTSRTLTKLIEQQNRLTQTLDRMDRRERQRGAARTGGGGGGGGGGPGFAQRTGATAVGSYLGNVAARVPGGSGAVSTAAGVIPVVGPIIQGAIQAMQGFFQSYVAQQQARGSSFGQTGMSRQGYGLAELRGAQFGMGPTQTAGMMGQLAQQTGMVGPELGYLAGGHGGGGVGGMGLLGLNRMMGFGGLGGVVGGAGTATRNPMGAEGSFSLMEDAVTAGVASGFREGRLDQFFQQFGGWIQQIRTSGMQIDPTSALQLITGTSRLGSHFEGEAGMQAAQGFQSAMGRAGSSTGQASMMMLRAGGMQGGGFGNRTFMEARRFLEENPSESMQNFMTMFRRVTTGASASQAALFAEQAFNQLGMQMTAGQALDFGERAAGEAGADFTPVDMDFAAEERVQGMMERRRVAGNASGGPIAETRHEALYEVSRANLGGRLRGAARQLRNFEHALANDFMPTMGRVITWLTTTGELIRAGDTAGLARHMATSISEASAAAGGGATPVTSGIVNLATEARDALQNTPLGRANPGLLNRLNQMITDPTGTGAAMSRGRSGGSLPTGPAAGPITPGPQVAPSGSTGPGASLAPDEDPASMIARGGMLILEGASRLREGQLPGEDGVGQASV